MSASDRQGAEIGVDSSVAERVLRFVSVHPGTQAMRASRDLGIPFSSAWRCLKDLEGEGHIEASERGRERYFFARYTAWEMQLVPLVSADEPWSIFRHAASRPGLENQGEITKALGIANETMQTNTQLLTDLKVIARVSVPAARRPGVGYEVDWRRFAPSARLLLAKLPDEEPVAVRLREVLHMIPPGK